MTGWLSRYGLAIWHIGLACLQCPDDPALLREAAGDLLCFGPDWDENAEALKARAAQLES
ncbi:hypothetical protein [Amycolatopsis rhizosphaerae]|uniref:hypothetical protein n=1 Tax=Amycolatopsis rhizosphaerae TaxID=2053003 RepID=UPI001C97B716|nr:hypothetical protein [Amycolatopsis rhizosphaerae]